MPLTLLSISCFSVSRLLNRSNIKKSDDSDLGAVKENIVMASDSARSFLSNFSVLGKVRLLHRVFVVLHLCLLCASICASAYSIRECSISSDNGNPSDLQISGFIVAISSCVRLIWILGSAITQSAVASTILAEQHDLVSSISTTTTADKQTRRNRRTWYIRWLWWGRFGMFVTLLQLFAAAYVTYSIARNASANMNDCFSAAIWLRQLFFGVALLAWMMVAIQCCIGPDVLAWSSLYAKRSDAWRAYYHEMFDYGIREALCCLGRGQYIAADEDEVDSVAAVLGELVSYRAAGASHLEFLAGLALLQMQTPPDPIPYQFPTAPASIMQEAYILHPFAVAAYTGPLLDVGRNPLLFPCAWLYRQGILSPWNHNRRPKLEGDNWWRGHAAAFLRYSKLPPEALLKGRVHQAKRECAYFVALVHHLRCVVVAVRGTETPEDLLTDGLGRESILKESDIQGILQIETIHIQEFLEKSHFAHEGIIEAARELAFQLDAAYDIGSGGGGMDLQRGQGLLSSLLGPGGICEDYSLRFVGHSLGGSIAAVTALRLYAKYPQLHVYGYGVLPCLDAATADACKDFVTSIVYNDEFSSRLSLSSIRRLRAAAVKALAVNTRPQSGTITRIARQLFGPNEELTKEVTVASKPNKSKWTRFKFQLKGGICLCSHACHCVMYMSSRTATPSKSRSIELVQSNLSTEGISELKERGSSKQEIEPSDVSPSGVMFSGNDDKHLSLQSVNVTSIAVKHNTSLGAGIDRDGVPDELEELVVNGDIGSPENSSIKREPFVEGNSEPLVDNIHVESELDTESKIPKRQQNGHHPFDGSNTSIHSEGSSSDPNEECDEMFMPGLVVHIVPVSSATTGNWRLWQAWGKKVKHICQHKAVLKDRKQFREFVISPSMFLDHMPWRCQYALKDVVQHSKSENQVINECESLV